VARPDLRDRDVQSTESEGHAAQRSGVAETSQQRFISFLERALRNGFSLRALRLQWRAGGTLLSGLCK
jgi:hypothetical protein